MALVGSFGHRFKTDRQGSRLHNYSTFAPQVDCARHHHAGAAIPCCRPQSSADRMVLDLESVTPILLFIDPLTIVVILFGSARKVSDRCGYSPADIGVSVTIR